MFGDLGVDANKLVIAILGVGVGLLLLAAALWIMRGRKISSPFVRGGKNRNPRLQVLDAAAVDARRRLVLVRRDDVEHLIMIGGPTDIVIESGITGTPRALPTDAVFTRAAAAVETPAPVSPRPLQVQRNTPVAEPIRESAAPREIPRPLAAQAPAPAPTLIPTAAAVISPLAAVGPSVPVPPRVVTASADLPVSQKIEPPVYDMPARQIPEVMLETSRPTYPDNQAPDLDEAANALDAARGRVFLDAPEPRVVPLTATNVPPALQSAADKPKVLGSDFERILEQEMASNLAAREPILPQTRQTPPRDPAVPTVTGATPEPSLQSEVARIFGEMSVTRDK